MSLYALERAMAAMQDMTSLPHGDGGVKVTVTLTHDTGLYEILSDAYAYARDQCWDEPVCSVCDGTGWVCEKHRDRPWDGHTDAPNACGCGAGAPCRACGDQASLTPGNQEHA